MAMLKVGQINLQHSMDATGELESILTGKSEIVLIQEPYVYRKEVRGLRGSGYQLLVGKADEEAVPRTAILASRDLRVVHVPQLGTRDATVAVLEIKVRGTKHRVMVGSVYLPYDDAHLPPTEELVKIVRYSKENGLRMILGCDANAHNTMWGSTDVNARGEALLEYLATTSLEILNRGAEPTFVNRIRQEVIDITLATRDILDEVTNWRVSEDISMSDHRMIRFNVYAETEDVPHRRNPRATNWDTFLVGLSGLTGDQADILSEEQLDQEVEKLGNTMIKAFEEACPLRAAPKRRVRWWNQSLKALRKATRRAHNKAIKEGNEEEWENYKTARREFKKELRKSKRACWRSYCGEINSLTESARLMRILSNETEGSITTLKKPDGTWTTSSEDSLRHLLEVHFPGVVDGDQQALPTQRVPQGDWQLAERVVTHDAIAWAVNEFNPYKAAGPDGIFPAMLQKGLESLTPTFGRIFRASIALGYVPKVWKSARVVFIPKAGKRDYTVAKSFRPISLTPFPLKTLEKVVDRFLLEGPLRVNPFHRNQHAYRKGRSTESALHTVVRRVERTLRFKEVTLGVFFDVEGAFDKAKTATIQAALMARGTPHPLVSWIVSSLTRRRVEVSQGDLRLEARVGGGCPQGSCLSPHLWCLVMDELLGELTDEGFEAQAYADDGVVLVSGRFIGVVCDRMQVACRIIERWCGETGLSVNPTKTEMILFTKRRKKDGFRPPTMFGRELELVQQVKYLGVVLDSKLSWTPHADRIIQKSVSILWQLRRIVGRNWGTNPEIMRWLYTAVVRPKIQYGSAVWWPGAQSSTIGRKLGKVQRLACLVITGAMRTTPTAVLEVLLRLPPLPVWIKKEAMAAHLRMRDSGVWVNEGEMTGHAEIAKWAEQDIPISALRVKGAQDRLRWNRKFALTIPSREQWEGNTVELRPGSLICYTDGSRLTDKQASGAGIYLEGRGVRESYALGRYTTVFQAEVFAILTVATRQEAKEGPEQRIYICSDSQAALRAICHPKPSSALVQECGDALEKLAETKEVQLVWVPGHRGVRGNEVADELARTGSATPFCGPEPVLGIARSQTTSALNDWAEEKLNELWRDTAGCRQSKDFVTGPSKSRMTWLLGRNRQALRLLIGILTGHNKLSRHLSLIGVEDSPTCRRCEEDDETSFHFLGECEAYGRLRFEIFGDEKLQQEDLPNLEWTDILTFIRRSRRFEKED